ncbi:purine permease [Peribacillus saganii]|uniref:Purine permease n=1 Tax=Peribacillus saganii TaxID=2303992 RepID=A0A372LQD1_9BACI|nr:purine/pyrimidine permease [Peribacillus saganii]RFU70418.1 purine permease [Peribacillus saganii]
MKNLFGAVQWAAFMIASSIVAPIAIADLFQLNPSDSAAFVQRTIMVLGIAGMIQVTAGHKLPINEGPAGLWWGVFALYAGFGASLFGSAANTLQALQAALVASGLLFVLLSLSGIITKISRLFTPVVTGVFLLLLVLQLSKSFISGMLGIGFFKEGIDLKIGALSMAVVFFTFYLTRHTNGIIRQYAILIALAAGWLLFILTGAVKPIDLSAENVISFPGIFVFGPPVFEPGMIAASAFVTLLLLTNMIASVQVAESVIKSAVKGDIKKASLKRAGFATGINQMLGGLFSAVGPVPISGAAGFIASTGFTARLPFFLGSLLVIILSFFPFMMRLFSSIPVPVGYAVTFVIFTNILGLALKEFEKETEPDRTKVVIAFSLKCGIGVMFLEPKAFAGLPVIATSILNNGMILGSIIAIFTDRLTVQIAKRRSNG